MWQREQLHPQPTSELGEGRSRLAAETARAFHAFSTSVIADASLSVKTRQLIAVAVAHVTQCRHCIRSHTGAAVRNGATAEEIMEAIWVAAEMRAGGAYAHSALALDVIARDEPEDSLTPENGAALSAERGVP